MRVRQLHLPFAVAVLTASAAAQSALQWRRLQSAVPHSGMVFDSLRERFVLQGERTWEWDGADWRERRTAHQPGAFASIDLAFDRARGRTVLFGGASPGAAPAQLWEYDGVDWTPRSLVGGPTSRSSPAMAYDSLRQRLVLFGGLGASGILSDTWTWDGVNWSAVPGPGPGSTIGLAAMAFHSATGRMVLFGGPTSGSPPGVTWTFDGASWQLEQPATRPVARGGHRMCEDLALGVVRLVGGIDFAAWEWNGVDWSATAAPPRLRAEQAIASDRSGTTLLRGGMEITPRVFTVDLLSDTWRLQSGTWTRLHDTGPLGAVDLTLTYDLTRGVTLCTATSIDRRTYVWSGGEWAENVAARLPRLFGARACHDLFRARFVMFGGGGGGGFGLVSSTPTASLFEYDGVAWTQNPAPGPSPRSKGALAFDIVNGEALLFGGSTGSSNLGD